MLEAKNPLKRPPHPHIVDFNRNPFPLDLIFSNPPHPMISKVTSRFARIISNGMDLRQPLQLLSYRYMYIERYTMT